MSEQFDFELELEPTFKRARSHLVGETDTLTWDPGPILKLGDLPVEDARAAKDIGSRLFACAFDGAVLALFERSGERFPRGGRVRLVARSPELARLPWEYTYDGSRDRFLFHRLHLVRHPPIQVEPVVPADGRTLRILVVAASPADFPVANVRQEKDVIQRCFDDYAGSGAVDVVALERGSWQALQRVTWNEAFDIVHFIGHGRFSEEHEQGYFVFESEDDGKANPVAIDALGPLLGLERTRLIVLNCCDGAQGGKRGVFSSAAAAIVRQGAAAVVAMQRAVSNTVAVAFTEVFYRAIAARLDVEAAVTEARMSLFITFDKSGAWGIPSLFEGTRTPVAFAALASGPETQAQSERRLAEIGVLYRRAWEQAESLSARAAADAGAASELVITHLGRLQLGPDTAREPAVATLNRLSARGTVGRAEEQAFRDVLHYAAALDDPRGAPVAAPAKDLEACMTAFESLVGWFFTEYLKRPDIDPRQGDRSTPLRSMAPPPDRRPTNHVQASGRARTVSPKDVGQFVPVWRAKPVEHALQFGEKVLRIEDPNRRYCVGREPLRRDRTTLNDLVLPSEFVSQDAATISMLDADVVLANTSLLDNVFVNQEVLVAGSSRPLRYFDRVRIGDVFGHFHDGRFYGGAPETSVDRKTGLLSQDGMANVVGLALAQAGTKAAGSPGLLTLTPAPPAVRDAASSQVVDDPEARAAHLARLIHRRNSRLPVARVAAGVAVFLLGKAAADELIADLADAGARVTSGWLELAGSPTEARARLEGALGAQKRLVVSGHDASVPADLARYALTPRPVDTFVRAARALMARGGAAAVFAIGEIDDLQRYAPKAIPLLELELTELIGGRVGPLDVLATAGVGLVALATTADVHRIARDIRVAWTGGVPMAVGKVVVPRALTVHLLMVDDLDDLPNVLESMAHDPVDALRLSGFPAPIAVAARAVGLATDEATRASRLVHLVERMWHFMALVLASHARAAGVPGTLPVHHPIDDWPRPWRHVAIHWATHLNDDASCAKDLASGVLAMDRLRSPVDGAAVRQFADGSVDGSLESEAVSRAIAELELFVREMAMHLRPLRDWTLLTIKRTHRVALRDAQTSRVDFLDHTGSEPTASIQSVLVEGWDDLAASTYLVRWPDEALSLEPFVRHDWSAELGRHELFLAKMPLVTAGQHVFRSISNREERVPVTEAQLGWGKK